MKASAVHGSAARAAPPGSEHRWTVLAVIAVAQLMVALDATVVNIALPTAEAGLGFTDAQRVWVITAYTCAVAGLLLLGGRVADRFGRRRAFLASLAGFALASALAGAAPGIGVLIAGRALQGAFAAVLIPTALALVAVTFTQPHERARAFGVYGAVASSGAAVGLLLGGLLTEYADWRWCLYINVPIAVAASAVGARVLPRQPGAPGRGVDVVSGALVTVGLAAVVYGCVQAAEHGWFAPQVIVPGIIGAGLVAGFVRRQRRSAEPMLPLRVLASRGRAGAYMSVGAAVVGSFGMFLMLTYYFQVVLSLTPIRAGLAFLPMSVVVLAELGRAGQPPAHQDRSPPARRPRPDRGGFGTVPAFRAHPGERVPHSGPARGGDGGGRDGMRVHPGDQRGHLGHPAAVRRCGCRHRHHVYAGGWLGRDGCREQRRRGRRHRRRARAGRGRPRLRHRRPCCGSRPAGGGSRRVPPRSRARTDRSRSRPMSVRLNHTIVRCSDKHASARFLTEILGLPDATTYGPFVVVQVDNDVSLDFADDHGRPDSQHYAFLVGDDDFDTIHARIVARGLPFWGDPFHRQPNLINTNDGGRGLYWDDPDGHSLEIITVPYGGAARADPAPQEGHTP